jgi:cytochrome c peroxidase
MSLYDSWNRFKANKPSHGTKSARAAIARGQALFNTKPIVIKGVKGINDDLGVSELAGTCTTCHNAPNSGNHSTPMPLDIGVADASRRTPDMPLYTLKNKTTGEIVKTTDPGRALLTGKWKDIGRFKGPILRAVASRPPYFHDGSAADLQSVIEFYNTRFNIGLTESEKADLVAFLAAL